MCLLEGLLRTYRQQDAYVYVPCWLQFQADAEILSPTTASQAMQNFGVPALEFLCKDHTQMQSPIIVAEFSQLNKKVQEFKVIEYEFKHFIEMNEKVSLNEWTFTNIQ